MNALFFAIMGGTLIFIFMYLAPDYLTEGWIGRFSAINDFGFDLTSETRFAEMYGQYEMWMESYISILFGRGWGAQYYWSGDSFDLVRSVLGSDFYGDEQFEAGHNFWFYSIFASGILFGVFFPAMILARVWNIFLNMVYMVDRSYCNVDLVVFSAAGVISFLLMTVGGNPMGTRYSALIYGVIFALTSPIIKNSRIIERY